MRLLFDQNLPPGLVDVLSDVFPASLHARACGLDRTSDAAVWEFVAKERYVLVSKDRDFVARSIRLGPPPLVAWVALGNCTTWRIADALRQEADRIDSAHSGGFPSLAVVR